MQNAPFHGFRSLKISFPRRQLWQSSHFYTVKYVYKDFDFVLGQEVTSLQFFCTVIKEITNTKDKSEF